MRHTRSATIAPIVLGHEFSGEVVAVGSGVTHCQPGDRVVVEPILACGHCAACKQDKYNLCSQLGFHGLSGGGGGFASYTVVQAQRVHKMPDALSFEQGALVEPAAVFGAGPIGLLIIEALRAAGASEIYAVELSPQRAAKATELGARAVIDPGKEDAVARLQALSDGGVDVAFEVTGVPAVLAQCINSTHYEGETVVVSIWEKEASFQPNTLVLHERSVKGIIAYRHIFPAVMELMTRGYFQADKLVSKKILLDDIVEQGFETLVREKQQVKILVQPPV